MNYFCIIKENIAYIEYVVQSSMFCSLYLFLSILLCNVDSVLVSGSNAYIWISNCILLEISNFIGKGEECLCWSWRNARAFSWTKVTMRVGRGRGRWAILAWRNYWIAPRVKVSQMTVWIQPKYMLVKTRLKLCQLFNTLLTWLENRWLCRCH